MFRFDLSLLSAHAGRSTDQPPHHAAIGDSSNDYVKTKQRKTTSKRFPSSPARTARTRSSSNCSASNNNTNTSIELDFMPIRSGYSGSAAGAASASGMFDVCSLSKSQVFRPPSTVKNTKESSLVPSSFPTIRRVPSCDSTGKKSTTFSAMGKSVSSVGKTVLKSLRKNMSLITAASFDSGSSSKMSSRHSKAILKFRKKNKSSSLSIIPREVNVSVVEGGEGVEIVTKSRGSDDSKSNSISSNTSSNSSNCGSDSDIQVPKIIRKISTFATASLTSREETDNAQIYDDDADIRKLCVLMKKIRDNSEDEDDDCSSLLNSLGGSSSPVLSSQELSGDENVLKEEVHRASNEASPSQPPNGNDFLDLMIFVNNERRVLEYTPDEFQKFDSS